MQKVTAGVSGIYNDDDDVAFWAGGTLQQAILTVMRFRNDPNYQPTDEEWAKIWRTSLPLMVAIRSCVAIFMPWVVSSEVWLKPWADFSRGKVETSVDGKRIVIVRIKILLKCTRLKDMPL